MVIVPDSMVSSRLITRLRDLPDPEGRGPPHLALADAQVMSFSTCNDPTASALRSTTTGAPSYLEHRRPVVGQGAGCPAPCS